MGKLVRVISGEMYDLLLDVRRESPTFGKRLSIHMRNGEWIWVPPCVAHGNYFPVETVIEYLCTAEYNKDGEHAICATGEFFFGGEYIVSEKDKTSPSFEEWRASCES
jgi:dTDP-4-dehydrorhamnose 3,5-epimerase-like enzyme